MATIAMPLLTIFTPATALLGLLLKNIEERIATELALKQSESMLSDHLHNTPLAAISWDKDSYVTRWNKAAEKIFGYTADEAIGRPSIDFIVSASQEKRRLMFLQRRQKTLKDRTTVATISLKMAE